MITSNKSNIINNNFKISNSNLSNSDQGNNIILTESIKKSKGFYWFLIKFGIYLLTALMPILFLPFSFEVFEYNKQYLLFFGVLIALIGWLGNLISNQKKLYFAKSPINFLVLALVAVSIVSTFFSVDRITSLFGFYGRFNGNLIETILLAILFFILINNVSFTKKDRISADKLILILLLSSTISIFITIFSVFGVWDKIGIANFIPQIMRNIFFNPVAGSMEALAIFLSIIISLVIGLWISNFEIIKPKEGMETPQLKRYYNNLSKGLLGLLFIASLFLMFIINFNRAWLVLIINFGIYLFIALYSRAFKNSVEKLYLPVFIFLIITFLFFLPFKLNNLLFSKIVLPFEVLLGLKDSGLVTFDTISSSIKNAIIGSGPSTFYYDFVQYKPQQINSGPLWSIRFDKPFNYFIEVLTTIGLVGFFVYLAIIIVIFLLILYIWKSELKVEMFKRMEFLLLPWLAILIAQAVYFSTTVLITIFWILLSLLIIFLKEFILIKGNNEEPVNNKSLSYETFPELFLIFYSIFILFIFFSIFAGYFAIRFYVADNFYLKGMQESNPDIKVQHFINAAKLNKYRSIYHQTLAQAEWLVVLNESFKPLNERDNNKIQNGVALAVSAAKEAVNISPRLVTAQENLAVIYKNISPLAVDSLDWSVKTFETAIELEKNNPVLYTELGKIYLMKKNNTAGLNTKDSAELIKKAKEYFNKALELKNNYEDANIQLSLLDEEEGKIDLAINRLEEFIKLTMPSENLMYQLGRLYYNNGELLKAKDIFTLILMNNPNNANAHYSLGLIYERSGLISDALKQFEIVNQLSPNNPEVLKKINALKLK